MKEGRKGDEKAERGPGLDLNRNSYFRLTIIGVTFFKVQVIATKHRRRKREGAKFGKNICRAIIM